MSQAPDEPDSVTLWTYAGLALVLAILSRLPVDLTVS